jgi:hypothetical protein
MFLLRVAVTGLLLVAAEPSAALETSRDACTSLHTPSALDTCAANTFALQTAESGNAAGPAAPAQPSPGPANTNVLMSYLQSELIVGFIAGVLITAFSVVLFGRTAIQIFSAVVRAIRGLLRFLTYPFRRLLRPLFRSRGQIEQAGSAALSQFDQWHYRTEIEMALEPDSATEEQKASHEEMKTAFRERRNGWWFRSYRIPSSFMPDHLIGPLTPQVAEFYSQQAKRFFSMGVPLGSSPNSLYEDVEGAVVIRMFRDTDTHCYHVLNEMRKTINDNVRGLVVGLQLILLGWFSLSFLLVVGTESGPSNAWGAITTWPQNPLFPVLAGLAGSALLVGLIMELAHANGYTKQQQHSLRELRLFLTRYLGRIADRYREVTGNAKQVTVGKETDSKKLSAEAQLWHKIMIWVPFRTFYIEGFFRNIQYQILRNSGYYLLLHRIGFLLLIIVCVTALWSAHTGGATPDTVIGLGAATAILFVWYQRLIARVVLADEISQLDWLGYSTLNVSDAMDAVVGKYAEDVGFWKGRFER